MKRCIWIEVVGNSGDVMLLRGESNDPMYEIRDNCLIVRCIEDGTSLLDHNRYEKTRIFPLTSVKSITTIDNVYY